MKKSILVAIVVLAVVNLFNSCTTPPIEAAQEAYDYNAIIPKVLNGIQGTTVAFQTTQATYTINYYRGGSTWNWSAEGATVVSVSEDTRSVTLEFPNDGTAKVIVTETTAGGVTSEPATLDITVNAFCPWTADDFVGTWTGTESVGGGDDEAITLTISKVDNTTIAINTDADGYPGLLQSVYKGWGETFQAGFGLDGAIHITVGSAGGLTLTSGEYWGQTLPGPYDYWYSGSGNWDGCTSTISLDFDMHWDQGSFTDGGNRNCIATLTKQ